MRPLGDIASGAGHVHATSRVGPVAVCARRFRFPALQRPPPARPCGTRHARPRHGPALDTAPPGARPGRHRTRPGRARRGARPMTPRFARLAPSAVALLVVCACGKAAPRNLLLVSIDTLRADRIGAYGYQRGTSPAMDRLAARGVRFETVIADSNWTLPSHMTLFTGRAPSVHGVTLPAHRLAPEVPTLAELLRARGYRTAAFTGGGWVLGVYGFARGFERYEDHGLDFPTALELAERKIRDFATDDRFFIFVHTYEVHCPYDPPSSYAARFRTRPPEDELETRGRCGNTYYNTSGLTPGQAKFLSDRYDASIRYADDLLAGFLERLEAGGRLSDTLVVVLSDHGEEFLEHGRIGHRATQYIESLRIPWIMVGPGLEPRVVQEPAGLADVMPTVLGLLRIPPPPSDGVSLLRVLQGRDAD